MKNETNITMDMDKKTMMENLAREAHEKGAFNGAWLYAEGGEIISKGAFGWRDAEDKLPMREDSIFDLASVSKQFTAAAIMLLVQNGQVRLEDEITKYFPKLPFPGITVRHLLTHTGGEPDPSDQNFYVKTWEQEKRIPDNRDMLRWLMESGTPPYFAPGEECNYSNTGFCLLALIVEQVSGLPFEDFLQKNLFVPAGMASTGVHHIRVNGIPSDNFVRNMVIEHDRFVLPEESEHERDVIATDGANGDDFVYSTVLDLFKWDRTLRAGTLITPASQQLMYTPARLNNGAIAYDDEAANSACGFGWMIQSDPSLGLVVNHSGWHKGATSWYERWIDADRMLVILWSRDAEDDTAYDAFKEGMRAIAMDKEPEPIRSTEDLTEKNPDRSRWESFCGKYAHPGNDVFYPDEVYLQDGELYVKFIQAVRGELVARLYPLGNQNFAMKHFCFQVHLDDGTLTLSFSETEKDVYQKLSD